MSSGPSNTRLRRELIKLNKEPIAGVRALPLEDNILEWRFVVAGGKDTPYEGGQYQGKLVFPSTYPHKPPSIMMLTPSGRFKTGTRICLTISDYHPEQWNPIWGVEKIILGLISFMNSGDRTTGSTDDTDANRRLYAQQSRDYNLRDSVYVGLFGREDIFQSDVSNSGNNDNTDTDSSEDTGKRPRLDATDDTTGGATGGATGDSNNDANNDSTI